MTERLAELYERAMKVTTEDQANEIFLELVEIARLDSKVTTRMEAVTLVRSNLGYWAGYYGEECRARVERLFHCEHPVFGSIDRLGSPTAWEAFRLGMMNSQREPGTPWITLEKFRQMPEHKEQPEEDKP